MYISVPSRSSLSGAAPAAVTGANLLERIKDPGEAPYKWLCVVDATYPAHGDTRAWTRRATGLLISPRHVLTTASILGDQFPRERQMGPLLGRVEAQKIVITPGLDGAPGLKLNREPVGSITLGTGDWWMPGGYLPAGAMAWDIALLVLPKELPSRRGVPYGYWSGSFGAPRTSIAPTAAAALTGGLVTVAGYPLGECTTPCEACEFDAPPRFQVPASFVRSPWKSFGRVEPAPKPVGDMGGFIYSAPTCGGMDGGPIWQNDGGLRLVGIHLFDNFRPLRSLGDRGVVHDRWSVGLALRPELVDLLRQRLARDGVRATF